MPHTKSVWVDGREYLYFVTARKNPKGKPILVRLPARTDSSFGAVYGSHMAALSRAKDLEERLSVPALVRRYEASPKFRKLAAGSQHLYDIYLRRFADLFEPAPADEINRKDILEVTDKMKPGAANSFVRVVGALYTWGRRRGLVTADPCKDIDPNEMGEHEPWPMELLEAGLAVEDDMLRLAIHLLYFTAQRIGDVCALRWTNIRGNAIELAQQKTGNEMVIAIHERLAAEMARHPRSFDTMLSLRGKPLKQATLRMWIKNFAKERGEAVVPHGLRKNAVNSLLEVGCTVAQTAAISGQSLAMVEHYARRRDRGVLGAAAILQWERGQNANGQSFGKP